MWQKLIAAYCRVYAITCTLTAYRPRSALSQTLVSVALPSHLLTKENMTKATARKSSSAHVQHLCKRSSVLHHSRPPADLDRCLLSLTDLCCPSLQSRGPLNSSLQSLPVSWQSLHTAGWASCGRSYKVNLKLLFAFIAQNVIFLICD